MENPYIAHRSEDGLREQTVFEHLEGTAALAEQFASAFGESEQGRLAGMTHDIGKYSDAFQRRIRGENISVDHSTAGAFECACIGQNFAAIAVAGHHGGIPDIGSRLDSTEKSAHWAFLRSLPTPEAWVGICNTKCRQCGNNVALHTGSTG